MAPELFVFEAMGQHVGVAHDPRELVIEVVRDAAGELTDGGHLVGLVQTILEPLPLGNVAGRRQEAGDFGALSDWMERTLKHALPTVDGR